MSNTSQTGGPLTPLPAPAPLEGRDLLRFVQQWVVGLCGLPGNMVRPRWQPEPPNIPASGDAWAAIGISTRPSDTYPFVGQTADGAQLQRHELLNCLSSWYGLGADSAADGLAAQFRDGAIIPQNLEYLTSSGFALIETGEPTPVPSLLKKRWLYRVDVSFVLRRQIDRLYPVTTILSAQGTVNSKPFTVTPPPEPAP